MGKIGRSLSVPGIPAGTLLWSGLRLARGVFKASRQTHRAQRGPPIGPSPATNSRGKACPEEGLCESTFPQME